MGTKIIYVLIKLLNGRFSLDQGTVTKDTAFKHITKQGIFDFLSSIDPEELNKRGHEYAEYNLIEANVTLAEYYQILKHDASEGLLERIYNESFGVQSKSKAYFSMDAGELWRFIEWYAEERNMNPDEVVQFIDYQSDKWRNALKEYISLYFA